MELFVKVEPLFLSLGNYLIYDKKYFKLMLEVKRWKIGSEGNSAIKDSLTSSQERNTSIGSIYVVLEIVIVLITIYSFFVFLIVLVERDRLLAR